MANRDLQLGTSAQQLKRATRAALTAAGGQVQASKSTRVGQQTLSDCASPNVDRFLPIDDAVAIDDVTRQAPGWPIILRQQAAELNCGVVVLPDAQPCSGDWHRQIGELIKEHSEALAPLMEALADGKVCARDVRDKHLLREADQAIAVWVTMRAMLAQAAEG